jgi:hypothetical protein
MASKISNLQTENSRLKYENAGFKDAITRLILFII